MSIGTAKPEKIPKPRTHIAPHRTKRHREAMLLPAQSGFVAALLLAVIAVNHSARGQGRPKDDRLVMIATVVGLMHLFSAVMAIFPDSRFWTGLFWACAGLLPITMAAMVRHLAASALGAPLGRLRWVSMLFALASLPLAFTPWMIDGPMLPMGLGLGVYTLLALISDQLRVAAGLSQDTTETGRLRLLWIGCALAIGMSGLEAVLGNRLAGTGTIAPVVLIGYLSTTLMRERLLDSQELIARGAIFGTITLAVTLLYSLLVVAFRQQGATFVFATLISSAVLSLLFDPLRRKVEATLMRLMMSGTAHLTEACFRARDGIRRSVQMQQMLEVVIAELHGRNIVTGAALYLLDPSEQFLGLAAFGGTRPSPRLWVRDAPQLFSRLRDELSALSVADISRERRRRSEWIGKMTAAEDAQVAHHDGLLRSLNDLGADLLLPIHSESRIIGMLAISDERRPEGYTPVERAALLALAGRLGIGLSNTHHADQLRLRDRLATLGEMSAGLAHEIRNPLGSIKGAAQLLEAGEGIDDESKEMLEIINNEVEHLNRIMTGFLDYARPSNLRRSTVEPADFLAAASRQLGDNILLNCDEGQAPIAIDPDRILQVLRNLVRNAREAAPDEKVEIKSSDRGDQLIIEVLDRGPGVSAELREQLFTPFVTSKSGGTGLGLAISQRIVKDHRGRLEIRPREGGGCIARMVLPRLASSADETEPPAKPSPSEGGAAT
jgi:two-component system sensor histidine kinase HydH